jgi:hypothetical protein
LASEDWRYSCICMGTLLLLSILSVNMKLFMKAYAAFTSILLGFPSTPEFIKSLQASNQTLTL